MASSRTTEPRGPSSPANSDISRLSPAKSLPAGKAPSPHGHWLPSPRMLKTPEAPPHALSPSTPGSKSLQRGGLKAPWAPSALGKTTWLSPSRTRRNPDGRPGATQRPTPWALAPSDAQLGKAGWTKCRFGLAAPLGLNGRSPRFLAAKDQASLPALHASQNEAACSPIIARFYSLP